MGKLCICPVGMYINTMFKNLASELDTRILSDLSGTSNPLSTQMVIIIYFVFLLLILLYFGGPIYGHGFIWL